MEPRNDEHDWGAMESHQRRTGQVLKAACVFAILTTEHKCLHLVFKWLQVFFGRVPANSLHNLLTFCNGRQGRTESL